MRLTGLCHPSWRYFFAEPCFQIYQRVIGNDWISYRSTIRICLLPVTVTSYKEFWHYYRQLAPDKRHFYEIIPEKAVCKLYFDLEYDKRLGINMKHYSVTFPLVQTTWIVLSRFRYILLLHHSLSLSWFVRKNPSKKSDCVMKTFFSVICHFVFLELGVRVDRRHFLDLDSSTNVKFR